MPDHLHAIIAFSREPGMETTMKNWKKFVAGRYGVNWQRDFFDHRLRDHHEVDEKSATRPAKYNCAHGVTRPTPVITRV